MIEVLMITQIGVGILSVILHFLQKQRVDILYESNKQNAKTFVSEFEKQYEKNRNYRDAISEIMEKIKKLEGGNKND